jgi:hypothetical protein
LLGILAAIVAKFPHVSGRVLVLAARREAFAQRLLGLGLRLTLELHAVGKV